MCGRRIKAGKVCARCRARIARELARARAMANDGRRAVGYRGTVRELRERVLPALARMGMEGLTVAQAHRRVQARLDMLMIHEGGWVA